MTLLTKRAIIGTIRSHGKSHIVGRIDSHASITGAVAIGTTIGVTPDYYEGPYEIVSSTVNQILKTTNKTFENDLVVKPIPYVEFENEYGGMTVMIG